jgi:hypothetical protein
VEREELLTKLELIEEQARLTLAQFPQHLTKERQRMIIALAKHLRWLVLDAASRAVPSDPQATVSLPGAER